MRRNLIVLNNLITLLLRDFGSAGNALQFSVDQRQLNILRIKWAEEYERFWKRSYQDDEISIGRVIRKLDSVPEISADEYVDGAVYNIRRELGYYAANTKLYDRVGIAVPSVERLAYAWSKQAKGISKQRILDTYNVSTGLVGNKTANAIIKRFLTSLVSAATGRGERYSGMLRNGANAFASDAVNNFRTASGLTIVDSYRGKGDKVDINDKDILSWIKDVALAWAGYMAFKNAFRIGMRLYGIGYIGDSKQGLMRKSKAWFDHVKKVVAATTGRLDSSRMYSLGTLYGFRLLGFSTVIRREIIDEVTDKILCKPYNYKEYSIEEAMSTNTMGWQGIIPAHPNCRGWWLPGKM